MSTTIHDSLRDARIPLPARTPGHTGLYVCGPTVYGLIHIGNARPAVVFDVLVRHLRATGRTVKYVRNFTDIDDKIIKVALDEGADPRAVAQRYVDAYHEDMAALRCLVPDVEPRVSEHLAEIVALVQGLIDRGNAYVTPEGDVYYDVSSFPGYGQLSKRRVDVQRSEFGRGRTGEGKRTEHDFALWKAAKPHEPPGARWPSPWGEGRPGWHIECSAMSHAHLGPGFDLHGGGMDLKFPHHENEIAQSEPVYGAPMARAWMHNGFIEMDLERYPYAPEVQALLPALREQHPDLMKISKSDATKLAELRAKGGPDAAEQALAAVLERKVRFGHWFQLRRLLGRVDGEALRLWILGTHYRSPLVFDLVETQPGSDDPGAVAFPALEEAEKRVEYLYETRARLAARLAAPAGAKPVPADTRAFDEALVAFRAALDDDLGTAGALDPLNEVARKANALCDERKPAPAALRAALATLEAMVAVLGVAEGDPEAFFARITARRLAQRGIARQEIDALVTERTAARARKDFARADELRAEITARGIELRDGPSGTAWRAV